MNKKQLKAMWVGIVLISAYGLFLVFDRPWLPGTLFLNFLLWSIVVTLVTGGLIVTFKDKSKDE